MSSQLSRLTPSMLGLAPWVFAVLLGASLAGCRPANSPALEVGAAVLERCTGEYQADSNTLVRVTRVEQQLGLIVNGRDSMLFAPESSTSFRHPASGTRIQFPTNASGLVTHLVLIRNGQTNEAPRITTASAASPTLAVSELPVGPEGFRFQVSGSGTTTVILWGDAATWRPVTDELVQAARVVTWTRVPPPGKASWPIPQTPDETVRALHAALTRDVKPRSLILVGHSFAGALARVYAASHTNGVAGLVLVDPFQEEFVDWLQVHQPENHQMFLDQMRRGYASDWPSTRAELRSANSFPSIPVVVLSAAHRAAQSGNEVETKLKTSDMAAGSDAVVAAHRAWISRIPGGKQILVEGGSHDIPHEQPRVVASAIRTLVDQIQSSRP